MSNTCQNYNLVFVTEIILSDNPKSNSIIPQTFWDLWDVNFLQIYVIPKSLYVAQVIYLHQWSSWEHVKIHIESQHRQGDCWDFTQTLVEQLDNQEQHTQLETPLHTGNTLRGDDWWEKLNITTFSGDSMTLSKVCLTTKLHRKLVILQQ